MNVFTLMGKVVIDAANAKEEIDNVTSGAEKSQGKIISAFKKIGTAVATYFAVSKIVDFGKSLVSLASSAEDAAAKVNTLLAVGTDTAKYFNDMLAASSQTGIAMADFSEAVYASISASVDQADAVTFAADAVKLAKAGFTETATAVDVLTTAINAYGLSSSDATHISDVLITTQNLGKTTVDELASSMGKVIPLASAYGVNLENLAAGYAVLTKGGIATAEATTYQKSMLTELADSGSNVAKILKKQTKQSFSDLMNAGYSLGDVLQILYESTGNNTTAFANLWSSTEAGTGALALVNAGVDEFNQTLDSMTTSANATEAAYAEVTSTFSEQIKRLKTNLQNVGIQIANKFLPALTSIVSTVADKVEPAFQLLADGVASARDALPALQAKFQTVSTFLTKTFSPAVTKIQQLFTRVKDAIAPLVTRLQEFVSQVSEYVSSSDATSDATDLLQSAFEALASGVETVVDGILAFSDWCAAHQGVIKAVAIVVGSVAAAWLIFNAAVTAWNVISAIATAVTTGFGSAIAFLTSPVTLVIAAIGALIAIVALCISYWDNVRDFFKAEFGIDIPEWETVKTAIETLWNNVKAGISDFFKVVFSVLKPDEDGGASTAKELIDWGKNLLTKIGNVFGAVFSIFTEDDDGRTVSERLKAWWDRVAEAYGDYISAIFQIFTPDSDGTSVAEEILTWFTKVLLLLAGKIAAVFGIDLPDPDSIINSIKDWWNNKVKPFLGLSTTATVRTVSQARESGMSDQQINTGLMSGDVVPDETPPHQRSGLDYVPYDDYLANLHYGEAVLTRAEADVWRSGGNQSHEVAAAVRELADDLPDMLMKAFASMRFDVNNREFARLVKAVT